MNIEPNMYVRTKGFPNKIGRITETVKINNETYIVLDNDEESYTRWTKDYFIGEPSHNIIDLIEVGDYVNGCMVINKKDDTIQIIQLIIPFDLKKKDIKSIVTKEMFANAEYKVGE